MKIYDKCPKCGFDKFRFPSDDNDDQNIYCGKCGDILNTKEEWLAAKKQQAIDLAKNAFKDAFKNLKP